jgi:hypothetical protein
MQREPEGQTEGIDEWESNTNRRSIDDRSWGCVRHQQLFIRYTAARHLDGVG